MALTPATSASFDLGTGAVSVQYAGTPAPTSARISDLVLNGPTGYMKLVSDGASAEMQSPGFPQSTVTIKLDSWPASGTDVSVAGGGVAYLDVSDGSGELKELIYVGSPSTNTSNVLYNNSSITNKNHTVTATPSGMHLSAEPVQAPAPGPESSESSWIFDASLCCSCLVYCVGFAVILKKLLK
jgi:hypothetical protein